jgi:hypothetical protein
MRLALWHWVRSKAGIGIPGLVLLCLMFQDACGQERRSRQDGLHESIASITAGEDNLHLTLFGRTFLWDNRAAQKIPPAMPHGELNYGVFDFADVAAGFNPMSYSLQTGSFYLRAKATTPNTKDLRFIGFGLQAEIKRNLTESFPSNGFRIGNEGFGPEGYIYGGSGFFSSLRLTMAGDVEGIRIASWLPLKGYANLSLEMPVMGSAVENDNARLSEEKAVLIRTQNTMTMPMSLGLQLKTFGSDFFVEVEAQPFYRHVEHYVSAWTQGQKPDPFMRFHMVEKAFDVHVMETPFYVNTGARLKYAGGLELQGGFAWQLSQERGASLGPCTRTNICRDDAATDGYSPFFPQWKVFGQIRYPLRFVQPSSELYRSFLLRRYTDHRKRIDVESTLRNTRGDGGLSEEEERLKRLMERRKEADDKALELQ